MNRTRERENAHGCDPACDMFELASCPLEVMATGCVVQRLKGSAAALSSQRFLIGLFLFLYYIFCMF